MRRWHKGMGFFVVALFLMGNGPCSKKESSSTSSGGGSSSSTSDKYAGTWTLTCPTCGDTGDTAAGTFTAEVANGVVTDTGRTMTSGTHGISSFSGAVVSSSGAITLVVIMTPPPCNNEITFTGQITGASMTMTYSRATGTCAAESGAMTATLQ